MSRGAVFGLVLLLLDPGGIALAAPTLYRVRRGDSLYAIARRADVELEALKRANRLRSDRISPGDLLRLPPKETAFKPPRSGRRSASYGRTKPKEPTLTKRAVAFARRMLNVPYRFGGNSLTGIDCSAYVRRVFRFLNVNLPRTAREQFRHGREVSRRELAAGDLVFFETYADFPSHVGIYLGDDRFIHASSRSKKVTIDNLDEAFYRSRFIGGRRILSSSEGDSATG